MTFYAKQTRMYTTAVSVCNLASKEISRVSALINVCLIKPLVLQTAYQENVVARETEERARRAREARALAERERRDRQHRYKQFVDMEQAQDGVMDR